MTTLLTGGTGFVGRVLIKHLDNVVMTTRNPNIAANMLGSKVEQVIQWNPTSEPLNIPDDVQPDLVVNLMGESIAEGRWTADKKQRIRDSRILGTKRLVDALIESDKIPKVMVSASAIGIYGDAGEEIVEEDHPLGRGFLAEVCQDWETENMRMLECGVRVVCLRVGIVLGATGGALDKMAPLFRWCLGGPMGSGRQWMAWIHINDLVSMIQWAANNDSMVGPVNATAPNPVRNLEFTRELAKSVGRPALFPAPRIALRLALGEFADSLFFSQRVVPAVALANGYQFQYSDVRKAISDVINQQDVVK